MENKCWVKIRKNVWASNTQGVISIQTIPRIDINAKVTGNTYSFGTSKKHSRWKRFNSEEKAIAHANKYMKEHC